MSRARGLPLASGLTLRNRLAKAAHLELARRAGALGALEEAAWRGRGIERLAAGAPPVAGGARARDALRHVARQVGGGLALRARRR